jgi:hypothetical protein
MIGASPLSRKGKKNAGLVLVREPSGRLSRSTASLIEASPASEVKRLRDSARRNVRDAEYGTEIGRLFLDGKVDGPAYAAGKRWSALAARSRSIILAPKQAPTSSTFVERTGGHSPDPDSSAGQLIAARERLLVQEFMEAHAVLIGAGMLAEQAVRQVCEDDRAVVGHTQLLALKNGLSWLAIHWGLTQVAK